MAIPKTYHERYQRIRVVKHEVSYQYWVKLKSIAEKKGVTMAFILKTLTMKFIDGEIKI